MTDEAKAADALLRLLDGYRAVQAVYVAAEIGVADALAGGPRPALGMARELGVDPPSLQRLLRALASLGVIGERDDGSFELTAVGELLRRDVPGSLRAAALFYGGRRHWTAWGQLLAAVRSGAPAFGGATPTSFATMAQRAPEAARAFDEAMASLTAPVAAAVVEAFDFSGAGTIVDVGGGRGALLAAVLRAQPSARGVLFEIESVAAAARPLLAAAGLADRCEVVAGDMFAAVPAGGDVYLLKWVLHDWDDERALAILRNCRAAMTASARLLVIERVLPARAAAREPGPNRFLSDLNMMLLSGGRERSEDEYRALLGVAGFALRRVLATETPHALLEAAPAPDEQTFASLDNPRRARR